METIHEAYVQMKAEFAETSASQSIKSLNRITPNFNELIAVKK